MLKNFCRRKTLDVLYFVAFVYSLTHFNISTRYSKIQNFLLYNHILLKVYSDRLHNRMKLHFNSFAFQRQTRTTFTLETVTVLVNDPPIARFLTVHKRNLNVTKARKLRESQLKPPISLRLAKYRSL